MSCISKSCVTIASDDIKKQRAPELTHHDHTLRRKGKEKAHGNIRRNMRAALECPKLRVSERMNFLMMRCNTLSQLFERDGSEEREMEIGHPTDVKHVTHIGWDGSTTVNPVVGWENLKVPEFLSFPSVSMNQFDVAMSAQARGPLSFDATKMSAS